MNDKIKVELWMNGGCYFDGDYESIPEAKVAAAKCVLQGIIDKGNIEKHGMIELKIFTVKGEWLWKI